MNSCLPVLTILILLFSEFLKNSNKLHTVIHELPKLLIYFTLVINKASENIY